MKLWQKVVKSLPPYLALGNQIHAPLDVSLRNQLSAFLLQETVKKMELRKYLLDFAVTTQVIAILNCMKSVTQNIPDRSTSSCKIIR